MIRFVVRFAVAVFLANAAYRIGSEYLAHLRFRDAVRDAVSVTMKSDDELRRAVMTLAEQHGVPLAATEMAIRQSSHQVLVKGSYRKAIDLLPMYSYPWRFELSVEADVLGASPEVSRTR
jgi:hypothetical protein